MNEKQRLAAYKVGNYKPLREFLAKLRVEAEAEAKAEAKTDERRKTCGFDNRSSCHVFAACAPQ